MKKETKYSHLLQLSKEQPNYETMQAFLWTLFQHNEKVSAEFEYFQLYSFEEQTLSIFGGLQAVKNDPKVKSNSKIGIKGIIEN